LAGKVFGGPNSIPIGPSSFYMKPGHQQITKYYMNFGLKTYILMQYIENSINLGLEEIFHWKKKQYFT
jgi:hypothetical protein